LASQNPNPNLKPPVGLIEYGLFSGSSEEAEPKTFKIQKTVSEGDGSYVVHVKLTLGAATDKPLTWYVAAVVARENVVREIHAAQRALWGSASTLGAGGFDPK
jgi:hypothetical protein